MNFKGINHNIEWMGEREGVIYHNRKNLLFCSFNNMSSILNSQQTEIFSLLSNKALFIASQFPKKAKWNEIVNFAK